VHSLITRSRKAPGLLALARASRSGAYRTQTRSSCPTSTRAKTAREVDVGAFELSLVDDGVQAEDDAWQDSFEADIQVLTDSGGN